MAGQSPYCAASAATASYAVTLVLVLILASSLPHAAARSSSSEDSTSSPPSSEPKPEPESSSSPGSDSLCLRLTPYVMNTNPTGATIRWETGDRAATRLCYRRSIATSAEGWVTVDGGSEESRTKLHSITLDGLRPDTLYEYKVLDRESECGAEESLGACGGGSRRSGIDEEVSSFSKMFRCRFEYMLHRMVIDDYEEEPWYAEEIALLASLPEACPGAAPVTDADLPRPERRADDERVVQSRAGDNCDAVTLQFKTSPPIGACGVRFRSWWLGDSGTGGSKQREVRDGAMDFMNDDWDATFAIGDNAYDSGTFSEYRSNFFEPYCSQLSRVGLFPTAGNHEARSSDSYDLEGPHFDLFKSGLPREHSYRSHYAYQYGRVYVVMLDLSYSEWYKDDGERDFLDWLDNNLEEARDSGSVDWIIAANHFPPYSKGSHNSDRVSRLGEIRKLVLPLIRH